MENESFPKAHTCFFTLDLPFYEDDEICRNRILSAAKLYGSVETDWKELQITRTMKYWYLKFTKTSV